MTSWFSVSLQNDAFYLSYWSLLILYSITVISIVTLIDCMFSSEMYALVHTRTVAPSKWSIVLLCTSADTTVMFAIFEIDAPTCSLSLHSWSYTCSPSVCLLTGWFTLLKAEWHFHSDKNKRDGSMGIHVNGKCVGSNCNEQCFLLTSGEIDTIEQKLAT